MKKLTKYIKIKKYTNFTVNLLNITFLTFLDQKNLSTLKYLKGKYIFNNEILRFPYKILYEFFNSAIICNL